MRISFVVLAFVFAGVLAVDLQSTSAPHAAVTVPTRALASVRQTPKTVDVAFVKNGWVVRVERTVPKRMTPAEAALRELTQGPTQAERRKGIRTALPDAARLRSLRFGVRSGAWSLIVPAPRAPTPSTPRTAAM